MQKIEQTEVDIELGILKDKNGEITPEIVVEFAKSHPKSALHTRFNWDVKSAAMEHWLQQARHIINVWVTVVPDRNRDRVMRATVSISAPTANNPSARKYISTEKVLSNASTRTELILNTLARIEGILASYPIDELKPLADHVERLTEKYAPKKSAA